MKKLTLTIPKHRLSSNFFITRPIYFIKLITKINGNIFNFDLRKKQFARKRSIKVF